MKNNSPCKDCICLASCKGVTSLLVLLHKCSLLRDAYNYNDKNIGDWQYEKIGIHDIDTADHNGIRKYLGG
jgi:hypothetical protein